MGIYDNVIFEAFCPRCGNKLSRFQTKDGDPMMSNVLPRNCSTWYDRCSACDLWVEFKHKSGAYQIDEAHIAVNYIKSGS